MDLTWLPLGAGGRSVRWNGRVFEAVSAALERRGASALYHSALEVHLPPDVFVVEMTPVWQGPEVDRGTVGEGAVGARWAGRSRLFRYEVRCWRGGAIGDVAEAVDSPQRVGTGAATCRRLLEQLREVPLPVWGRDELRTGEMWNSNSVTSWALARSGVDAAALRPPAGGRAPGWAAGIVAAHRCSDSPAGHALCGYRDGEALRTPPRVTSSRQHDYWPGWSSPGWIGSPT